MVTDKPITSQNNFFLLSLFLVGVFMILVQIVIIGAFLFLGVATCFCLYLAYLFDKKNIKKGE